MVHPRLGVPGPRQGEHLGGAGVKRNGLEPETVQRDVEFAKIRAFPHLSWDTGEYSNSHSRLAGTRDEWGVRRAMLRGASLERGS